MLKTILYIILSVVSFSALSQNEVTTQAIPGEVNSKFQDVRPVISDDGKTLYLNRRFHPENIRGEKDFQDVWVSRLDPRGFWSKPFNLKEPYNDKKANDLVRASKSGDSLVFVNDGYKGVSSELALFLQKNKSGIELPIDGYYNNSPYVDFDYHFKEKVIIMAVERKDSKGDQDLYYSVFQPVDGRYSTPMSMGKTINSEKADFAPFLTVDGNTIFFASYGHQGNGASDLFMSHRVGDGWDEWSKPENLGKVINSSFEETFVSIDPSLNYLYYDSYPAGATNRNIWRATLSDEVKKKILAAKESRKPFVRDEVVSSRSNQDNDAQILDNQTTVEPELSENTGPVAVEEEKVTEPTPETPSEISKSEEVDVMKEKVEVVNSDISNEPVLVAKKAEEQGFFSKIGEKLGLGVKKEPISYNSSGAKGEKIARNIYFKFNSDKVQFKQNSLIEMIAAELKEKPEAKLLIEGHADGIGGEDINKDLSCRRAKNVREALTGLGINPLRIEISCEGKERPLASNDDEFEGRELNRRVELYVF